jgi:hypothetical protein
MSTRKLRLSTALGLALCLASTMALDVFSIPPSALAAGICPNEQLRAEQPYGATLPDCRVSFELTLPEGPYSALAANGDLCSLTKTVTVKKKVTVRVKGRRKTETRRVRETQPGTLEVPSAFVGQNGAEIHQDTPVTVSGCPRATAKDASKKKHKRTSGREQGRKRK